MIAGTAKLGQSSRASSTGPVRHCTIRRRPLRGSTAAMWNSSDHRALQTTLCYHVLINYPFGLISGYRTSHCHILLRAMYLIRKLYLGWDTSPIMSEFDIATHIRPDECGTYWVWSFWTGVIAAQSSNCWSVTENKEPKAYSLKSVAVFMVSSLPICSLRIWLDCDTLQGKPSRTKSAVVWTLYNWFLTTSWICCMIPLCDGYWICIKINQFRLFQVLIAPLHLWPFLYYYVFSVWTGVTQRDTSQASFPQLLIFFYQFLTPPPPSSFTIQKFTCDYIPLFLVFWFQILNPSIESYFGKI